MSPLRSCPVRMLVSAPALAALAAVLAAVLAGCGSSGPAAAPAAPTSAPAATAPTTAAPTTTAPTTTTTIDPNTPPSHPQPTTEAASAVFMDGWMAADRARSASVATPAAVATLYATPYAGQPLNDRGCTDAFPPLICTWGPYAYGHGSIYQVQLTPQGANWYVSAVTILS